MCIRDRLSRLAKFGLITLDFKEGRIRTKQHTIQTLEGILDAISNPYVSMLSSFISRQDPPLAITNTPSYIDKLKNDPLIAKCWEEIEQAIDSLERGNYHAALRTVLPIVERLLRDIAVQEGIAGTNKGLKALVDIVKGHKLISDRTEGLIKALGRDIELHGLDQLDIDRARFYAELSLITIIELVRDYRRHKLLHQALQKIAQQLGISTKELIKAYPENRRIVHVQFLSDTKLRITIKGKHVFEVKQENSRKLKIDKEIKT